MEPTDLTASNTAAIYAAAKEVEALAGAANRVTIWLAVIAGTLFGIFLQLTLFSH